MSNWSVFVSKVNIKVKLFLFWLQNLKCYWLVKVKNNKGRERTTLVWLGSFRCYHPLNNVSMSYRRTIKQHNFFFLDGESWHCILQPKLFLGQTLGVSQSLYKIYKIIKVTALDDRSWIFFVKKTRCNGYIILYII